MICCLYFWFVWERPLAFSHCVDLRCYLDAAQGNYAVQGYYYGVAPYVYPKFLAVLWKPLLLLPFHLVYTGGFLVGCISYLYLVHQLLKKDIGGLIAIIGLKSIATMLDTGNIYPLLAALATNPLGIILGTLFKFPIAGLGFILFFVQSKRHSNNISSKKP
jgi:hypothetical protein